MRIIVLFCLLLTGCGVGPFRRASVPPPPPGPTPVRIPDVTNTAPAPPPKNLPAPPPIATPGPDAKPGEAAVLALPKAPTAKPPKPIRPKRAARKPTPAPSAAASVTTEAASIQNEPAQPVYRLGELRPPEERERLRRQSEQFLSACAAALSAAEGRTLTPAQAELVSRVRGFAQQAREVMDTDPVESRNLAAKGKSFADSLLAELR